MARRPAIHHCTSEPYRFFGRTAELAALDKALRGGAVSVAALVGPGGQGKTAIVQHWLQSATTDHCIAGVFFWPPGSAKRTRRLTTLPSCRPKLPVQ